MEANYPYAMKPWSDIVISGGERGHAGEMAPLPDRSCGDLSSRGGQMFHQLQEHQLPGTQAETVRTGHLHPLLSLSSLSSLVRAS